jgi:signal transduction histidine kinase
MDRLIIDVVAWGRIASPKREMALVNIEKLVKQIVAEDPSLQPFSAVIKVGSPLLPMWGDESLLGQCISNLLTNAVKFMPPGVVPAIRVRSEAVGDEVRLWFEDNGIGIAKDEREMIFHMFQRLESGTQYEGTGIGLAIVRKAIRQLGGEVGIESEVAKGSRFWLQLPGAKQQ